MDKNKYQIQPWIANKIYRNLNNVALKQNKENKTS